MDGNRAKHSRRYGVKVHHELFKLISWSGVKAWGLLSIFTTFFE